MKITFANSVAVTFLLAVSCGFSQQANTTETLMFTYGQARQKIDADAVTAYSNVLVMVGSQLKRNGDVDAYLLLDAEKKRLVLEGTIEPGTTNAAQAIADTAKAAVASRNCKLAILLRQYIDGLDRHVRPLMMADKIADAKAVKDMAGAAREELAKLESMTLKPKPVNNLSSLKESGQSAEKCVVLGTGTIFYDSFEAPIHPDVREVTKVDSGRWVRNDPSAAGLTDVAEGKFTTSYGTQAAYVYDNSGEKGHSYTATNIAPLLAGMTYTLTFNVAAESIGQSGRVLAGYGVDLLAGTNVLGTVTGAAGTKDASEKAVSLKYTAKAGDATVGKQLGIRLRKPEGIWNGGHIIYDNVKLTASK